MLKGKRKILLLLIPIFLIGFIVFLQSKPKVEKVEQPKETKETTVKEEVKKEEVAKKGETVKVLTKKEEKAVETKKTEVKKQPQMKAITKSVTTEVKTNEKKSVKKVTEKKCRLVVVKPAVYKIIEHPAKIRKEPIYKSERGTCVVMPDGSEVEVTGWDIDKLVDFQWKHRAGRTKSCKKPKKTLTGYFDVIEKEAWEEEVLVTPEVTKEICE